MARLWFAAALLLATTLPARAEFDTPCFKESGEKAIASCTRELKAKWQNAYSRPYTLRRRADIYFDLKKYNKSIADLDQVIASPNVTADDYRKRGNTLWWADKLKVGIKDLKRAYDLAPANQTVAEDYAIALFELRENNDALKIYNELSIKYPKNAEYHSRVSRLALRLGYTPTAVARAKEASRLSPKEPNYWYDQGEAEFTIGDYSAAIASYSQAILMKPSEPYFRSARASAYYRQGKYADAAIDYGLAAKELPDKGWYKDQAYLYAFLGKEKETREAIERARKHGTSRSEAALIEGRMMLERGLYDKAIQLFDKALKLDPKAISPQYWRSRALSNSGRPAEALPGFKKAVSAWSDDAIVMADYADALLDLGRETEAEKAADAAVQRNRKEPFAFVTRARLHSYLGNYEKARADADTALALDPKYIIATYRKAYALRQLGEPEQAAALYTTYISANPKAWRGYQERARAYVDLRKFAEAKRDIDAGFREGGDKSEMNQLLGWYHEQKEEFELAVAAYDAAVAINPKDGWAYEARAWGQMGNHKPVAAIDDCRMAIKLMPKSAAAYRCLARALVIIRHFDEARQTLHQALRVNPAFGPADFDLGYNALSNSEYETAVEHFTAAITKKTWLAHSYLYRGDAYKGLGLKKSALRDYSTALQSAKGEMRDNVAKRIAQIDKSSAAARDYPQLR